MGPPRLTQAKIERALAAAKAAGLDVTSFVVRKDGAVEVSTKKVDTAVAAAEVLRPKKWGEKR
jgi:hypothetical protein